MNNMENRMYSREELVSIILDNDKSLDEYDNDDITELVLETKVTKNINEAHDKKLTRGDILADKLASFAGSWVFISAFAIILAAWIGVNVLLGNRSYDPYPFILLNLILSCIAAMQAPIIMMSQNRQEEKDRLRSMNDFRINMKSEFLIEELYSKIDEMNRAILELKEQNKAGQP
jgi:uncharacterized membrane protein